MEQQTEAEHPYRPSLPCPNCQENILATGFYNYCFESVGLREDNRTDVIEGRVDMDHDESGHETTDHEGDVNAYCAECDKLLPWPLYDIRALDGCTLPEAQREIEDLLAKIEDEPDAGPNEVSKNDAPSGEDLANA